MFGADEIVVEPVGFLARQRENLLRSRREIVHGFIAHNLRGSTCFGSPGLSSRVPAVVPIRRLTIPVGARQGPAPGVIWCRRGGMLMRSLGGCTGKGRRTAGI